MKAITSYIAVLFDQSTLSQGETTRKKLFEVILWGVLFSTTILLITLVVTDRIFHRADMSPEEWFSFTIVVLMVWVAMVLVFLCNRFVSSRVARVLFVALLLAGCFADTPVQISTGRSLLYFSLPIIAAGVLIHPAASLVLAAISSFLTGLIASTMTPAYPDLTAMLAYFLLAIMTWLSTSNMEKAISQLQEARMSLETSDTALEQTVLEQTQQLRERKQAEEAVKNSEKRFRALIEHGRDNISLLAADGILLWESPSATSTLGYAPNQFVGGDMFELMHPDDQAWARETFAQLLQTPGGKQDGNFRLRHGDGTWRWIESTATNMLDEPSVQAIVLNYRDITERKRAEQQLAYQASLLARISDAVVATDADMIIRSWNEGAERMFGYTADEVIGQSARGLSAPEYIGATRESAFQQIDEKGEWKGEVLMHHKDGSVIYASVAGSVLRDEAGMINGYLSVNRDITERKRAEETFQLQRAALNAAANAVVITNREGSIEWANPAFTAITGYAAEEAVGKNPRELVKSGEHGQAFYKHMWDTILAGKVWQGELVNRRKDGSLYTEEQTITPLQNADGSISHFIAIKRDITERKRAEEKIVASESELRALFAAMIDVVIVYDTDGRYIKIAPTKLTSFYRPLDDMLGKTVHEILSKEQADYIVARIREAIQTNRVINGEYALQIGGEEKWFSANVSRLSENTAIWVAHDITERKRAEDALQKSEERLRNLFENSPIAIWEEDFSLVNAYIADLKSKGMTDLGAYLVAHEEIISECLKLVKITDVNQAALKLYEAESKSDLLGELQKTFPTEALMRFSHELETVAKGNLEFRSESRIQTFRGSFRNVSISWIVVPGHEQTYSKVLVSLADITELKQAEIETHHHMAELEMLYESGLALSQILSPKEIGQKIIELLKRKMNWHHTAIRLYHPQDETLEILAFSQPGLNGEEERRKVEERFGRLISKSGEGLSGWAILNSQIVRSGDVSNDPRYIATYPGLHSGLYVPMKSSENLVGVISIESGEPNAFSEADERLVATLANQAAVALENARLFQITQQEITERKKVEVLLADEKNQLTQRVMDRTADISRVNADLARALRSRDEFLASMSHELRTPLTGILGFSEALQLKTYGELNEKQLKAIKIIEESGRHLLVLISDILDLSKIEAGKLQLQFAPCSLADICQSSLQLTKGMAQQKKQNVQYSPAAEPIMIRADARRIKQILVNLLGNAVKFTPEEGELGLEVQADEPERIVKLTVWDKGIGIKSGDMRKLFKPFTQIDGSLAREYSGTGLGLSLVQRLVDMHSGGIEVESVLGKGSRFTISLPWSRQDTTPIPYTPQRGTGGLSRSAASPEYFQSPLVIIADDNETILQMIADFLETEKYRIVKVRSGVELLERAAELHPDMMLVDIQMPGMDGLETIRHIRAHEDPLIAAAPVIAVTALVMPGDREICLESGANDYMSKPVRLKELAAAIQKLLEDKQ